MEATAIQGRAPETQTSSRSRAKSPRRISWEAFEKKYLAREDAYKYEWVDGMVEKAKRAMDIKQFIIYAKLNARLESLRKKGTTQNGIFIQEGDIFFEGNYRRPDSAPAKTWSAFNRRTNVLGYLQAMEHFINLRLKKNCSLYRLLAEGIQQIQIRLLCSICPANTSHYKPIKFSALVRTSS